jgi:hypothetical protein
MALESRRAPVNFNTVAAEAGVSKDFLYRHEELRTTIMKRRQGNTGPTTPPGERTTESSAAVKLAVATKALAALRVENKALREENARLLGEVLTQRKAPSVTNHSAPQ